MINAGKIRNANKIISLEKSGEINSENSTETKGRMEIALNAKIRLNFLNKL